MEVWWPWLGLCNNGSLVAFAGGAGVSSGSCSLIAGQLVGHHPLHKLRTRQLCSNQRSINYQSAINQTDLVRHAPAAALIRCISFPSSPAHKGWPNPCFVLCGHAIYCH